MPHRLYYHPTLITHMFLLALCIKAHCLSHLIPKCVFSINKIIFSLIRPSNLKIPVKKPQTQNIPSHACSQEVLPIIQRTVQASVHYWLFKKAKGGNKSLQCHLTASEINRTKHIIQFPLGSLDCSKIIELLVLKQCIRKNYLVICTITDAMRNVLL